MFNYLLQTYFNMHLGEGLEERKQLGPRTTPSVYYMPSMDLGLMVQDLPVLFSGLSPTRVRLFGALCITAVLLTIHHTEQSIGHGCLENIC